MIKRTAALALAGSSLALWSLDAHAQKIPWIVLPLAASPLVAILISVTLGIMARSWKIALLNTALVIVWVAWFIATSKYVTTDWIIWASMVALAGHMLVMLGLIALRVIRRIHGP